MSDWLSALDEQQRKAVLSPDGPLIVLAGAGTGKTRVLTYRIAHLLERGVNPASIVALTFTNKAADTMRQRLEGLVGAIATRVWMGTFHSLAARWLRGLLTGYPVSSRFVIYDEDDVRALLAFILKEHQVSSKEVGRFRSVISRWKNAGLYPEAVQPESPAEALIHQVYQVYQKRLRLADALDFDDLLLEMNRVLQSQPAILSHFQQRYKHLLVDEFQDTNDIQYQIVAKIASHHRNIFVVGDDAQSIYSFRGANVRNFQYLQRDFPDVVLVKLEKNYRSTPAILALANITLRNSQVLMAKQLFTHNPDGPAPQILEDFQTSVDEASYVARQVRELVMRTHLSYRDIAVLYRINAYSRALEDAFRKERIPYRLIGALSFYQREEVKHLLAYLRLVHNPEDDQALLRILPISGRGIGRVTLERWQTYAHEAGQSLWAVMEAVAERLSLPYSKALLELKTFLGRLRERARGLPLSAAVEEVLQQSGLIKYYSGDEREQERLENLEALIQAAESFEATESQGTLADFLTQTALYTSQDEEKAPKEAVWLSTVHGVKGMEFDTVFVVGVIEGLMPHSRAAGEGLEGEEEERRIFYVALTRASRRLYLCRPRFERWRGELVPTEPSRFLEELKGALAPKRVAGPVGRAPAFAASKPMPSPSARPKPSREGPIQGTVRLSDLSPGCQVLHSHFGRGTVIACEENGSQGVVLVEFETHGRKRLNLQYAKLERIS